MLQQQNPEEIKVFILALSVTSFGFILYHTFTNSPVFKLWESFSSNNTKPIMLQRLFGVFFFGISSMIAVSYVLNMSVSSFGVASPNIIGLIWLLILSVVMIPMNYFNAKNPDNLAQYPQIRHNEWSSGLLVLSALSWIAYLLAYEFMFRGFLLFSSLPVLGVWPSIILNTAIYSLVHIPKGSKETLGAIPFGIFLSYLAIETGSFWIAFFAHVVLALSNEWFSLSAHPDMNLKKSNP